MRTRRSISVVLILAILLGFLICLPESVLAEAYLTDVDEQPYNPLEPVQQDANEINQTAASGLVLNYSVKDVDEGVGFTLRAVSTPGTGGTITWSSSNNGVATVSTSGYVLGKKAGTTLITATYRDTSGTTTSTSCSVHVTIADGIYYIKNASSGLCMYTSGSSVSIQTQNTNVNNRLGQLWHIEYKASCGRYIIRPLKDFSVALGANVNDYLTVGSMSDEACWDIVGNSFGYAIRYYGSSSENAKPIVADMPGSQICLGSWETSLTCHWELEKAYGIFLRNIKTKKLADSSTKAILGTGRSCYLSDIGVQYEYYGSMNGGMTWSSNNTNAVRVVSSSMLTGVTQGEATITVSAKLNNVTYSYACCVKVESSVLVLSNSPDGWMASSQTMGANMASAVDAEASYVQAVYTNNFASVWNNATSDHIIIHTHGTPNSLDGEDLRFITNNITQLVRNSAIRFVLITACETGGQNGNNANIASLLSQCIAQEGVVVCSTTKVSGDDTYFTATGNGEWIAYRNGVQITCNLPTTITMALVADFWEDYK